MNRRWLALAAIGVAGAIALVVGLIVAGGSDDDSSSGTTQTTTAATQPGAASIAPPSAGSRPAASSPAEQRATEESVLAFWTPARVRAALNHPDVARPGPSGTRPKAALAPPGGSQAQTKGIALPGDAKFEKAAASRPCKQPRLMRAKPGYKYTRSCYRGSYKAPPARMMGQLFFELPPKYDEWVCSATVAGTSNSETPGNASVLVTAGHCMGVPAHGAPNKESNGQWQPVRNLIFIPTPVLNTWRLKDFPSEKASHRWLVRHAWLPRWYASTHNPVGFITNTWHDQWEFTGDFAAIVMAPRTIGGRKVAIANQLGGLGVTMKGAGVGIQVEPLGFPAGDPFKGYRLFECHGRSSQKQNGELGVGCDMTGGSSGGPWLADTDGDGSTEIVSVNSNGPPNIMFGPNLNARDHWPVFDSARKS